MKWLKEKFRALWEAFFYKNGKISKTAIFLSLFSIALLIMWIFQGLFVGVTLFGWWLVPEFNTGAATAVMTIFSALYILNHGNRTGTQAQADIAEVAALRDQITNITEAIASRTTEREDEPEGDAGASS